LVVAKSLREIFMHFQWVGIKIKVSRVLTQFEVIMFPEAVLILILK